MVVTRAEAVEGPSVVGEDSSVEAGAVFQAEVHQGHGEQKK